MKTITLRVILLLTLVAVFSPRTFSQLSGTYTVGGSSPDFATVNDAVNALNANGISGNVTFNIRPGTYAGDNAIFPFTGSATFSTTFRSENGNAAGVTIASFGAAFQLFSVENMNLENMTMSGGSSGVEAYSCTNTTVRGNRIMDAASYGILSNDQTNSTLEANTITGQAGFNPFGIYQYAGKGTNILSKNKISFSGADSPSGIIVDNSFAATSGGLTSIQNNFVATTGLTHAYGIQVFSYENSSTASGGDIDVVFNSVNVYGASAEEATAFFLFYDNGHNTVDIFDNVFVNQNNAGSNVQNNNASRTSVFALGTGTINMNYNDFHVNPGPYIFNDNGTTHTTLATHQAQTGWDANSILVNPNFTSNTDLHASNTALAAGTPWPGITTDIDGQPRSATTPWMGADEGSASITCGNNKVLICHRPPGNPANAHTLCVPQQAVAAHLSHGCTLGPCPSSKMGETLVEDAIHAFPNPCVDRFSLSFSVHHSQTVEVEVMDVLGQRVQSHILEGMEAGTHTLNMDVAALPAGIYMVKCTVDGASQVQKVTKE